MELTTLMPEANHNQPDANAFSRMSPGELREYRDSVAAQAAETKQTLAAIDGVIAHRFAALAQAGYDRAGKDGGTLTEQVDATTRLKASRSKKVEWDQGRLKAMAGGMSWAEIEHLFDITFKVPEKVFDAYPPGPVKDNLTAARTVTWGATKIALEAV